MKVLSSKDEVMKWIDRANNTGSLSQRSARETIFGAVPLASINSTSKAAYLQEIYDVSKAKDILINLPST